MRRADVARRPRTSRRRTRREMLPDTTLEALDRRTLCPPGCESARTRQTHQLPQTPRFRTSDLGPEARDLVIPPPLVVMLRRRPVPGLDDQTLLEHSLNRSIQCSRTKLQLALRTQRNILNDG